MKLNYILLLSVLLAGCGSTIQQQAKYKTEAQGALVGATSGLLIGSASSVGAPLGVAIGGVIGGVAGQYLADKRLQQLEQVLQPIGGQVVTLGGGVRIIIPADSIFDPSQDKLKLNAEPTLQALASYLRPLTATCITVAGYHDAMPDRIGNLKIATLRAQRIVSFLWDRGFNEQCLQAIGYGQGSPIASNETIRGRAFNRRIEITFWQGIRR